MNYINRTMEALLLEASKYFSVLAVTGPRQSGKSTLLGHLFPEAVRYSMKDVNVREFAENDPIAFLNSTKDVMFIDEVQKVPELFEYIQGIVDADPDRKFLLSGSSNFEIMKSVSESLAGRAGVYELLPLSLTEAGDIGFAKGLDEFLFDGLFPAVCSEKSVAKFFYPSYVRTYYPSYVRTYLEKDVRDLMNVKDMMQFTRFMKLCAARVGSILNVSEICSELGVDNKTATSWLSVLTASYVVYLLPPYFENISKRLIKSPKNYVVMEAVKHRMNAGREGGVYFYRDSNGNEVDLLLKEEGRIQAFEIKSSMTYTKDFEKTLRNLPSWLNTPVERRGCCLCRGF